MDQEKLILKLLDELKLTSPKYALLKNYHEGNHKILSEKSKVDQSRADMRVYFNYCRKTVQNFVGYLLGKPLSYSSKTNNKEFLEQIDYYFGNWEKEHNINLKIASEVYGRAYEVSFINTEGEFQCAVYDPLEMIVLYDGSINANISLAVRKYQRQFDDSTYIEVWDEKNYILYKSSGDGLVQLDLKPHRFSRCPVRELKNNDLKKSAFEDIIRIVDVYNSIHSTSANEILDHRNAYLAIEDAKLTKEKAQEMKENGILLLPKGAKAYWIVKDINATFVKDMLKQWKDEIYTQTGQIDLVDNPQSNTSGISLRLRMQELENISAIKESLFEKTLKDRLKFFCEWLSLAFNKDFDYRDINISFTRNVPVDEASIVTMVRDLQGIVPNEELISWLPRISNPSAIVDKLKQEQDSMNLDEIGNDLNEQI
ncbi:phage portal protein [Priestia koreensis]|uniref:Portal protein n=1 Tax=Priestia koreensis TaxID=284581 RepID=A0A0M0L6A8_9BACI|nr:phage portal protein [Priestia koreensis]KOO46402.1 portal protein [Priestia koreensis]